MVGDPKVSFSWLYYLIIMKWLASMHECLPFHLTAINSKLPIKLQLALIISFNVEQINYVHYNINNLNMLPRNYLLSFLFSSFFSFVYIYGIWYSRKSLQNLTVIWKKNWHLCVNINIKEYIRSVNYYSLSQISPLIL